MCWCGAQGLIWDARGPLLPAKAMVVAVVTPVGFVLRLMKNAIKTLKIVVCKEKFLFIRAPLGVRAYP